MFRPLLAALVLILALPALADQNPQTLLAEIAAARLEPDRAVALGKLQLAAGLATLEIDHGTLFPAGTVGGATVEMVFLGQARLVLPAPDAIEAGQLELYTGAKSLDAEFSEAVLVLANDAAGASLLARGRTTPDSAQIQKAEALFDAWRASDERRVLGVETGILDAALGPLYRQFAAAWIRHGELDEFLYLVDPGAREQVSLGRFRNLELSDKEKRRLERRVHKAQRRGRLIGLEVDELGEWETWLSAPLLTADGKPQPGRAPFEPVAYRLEARFDDELELQGRATIEIKAETGGTRIVRLTLYPDLKVEACRDAAGRDLFFRQDRGDLTVVLENAPNIEQALTLTIEYRGKIVDQVDGAFQLSDTLVWHPRLGEIDRATYEARFDWPSAFELLAAGRLLEEGRAHGRRFERRAFTRPTLGLGFEIGRFRVREKKIGGLDVRVAVADKEVGYVGRNDLFNQLFAATAEILPFFEKSFGSYPLEQLTLVTTRRNYSQSLWGFVTFAEQMLIKDPLLARLAGLEDPRTVIAHELAHQWWGHAVGWDSYRSQWLSEALASYSAELFARSELERLRPGAGPTSGWQAELLQTTADGRPLEAAGPLLIAPRLTTERAGGAYQPLAYRKGPVVLAMLARRVGEPTFLEALKVVVEKVDHRALSTETFVAMLGRLVGLDLEPFAQRFIYATGLPEIVYDYRFEKMADGRFKVKGQAIQQAPYHFRYLVAKNPNGRLDVMRERVLQGQVEEAELTIPVEIAVYDPSKPPDGDRDPRQTGNATVRGQILLSGAITEIDLNLALEPKEVFFDRKQQVFGRFFNEKRYPKRMAFYAALDQSAAGDFVAAEASCREALAAELFAGPEYWQLDKAALKREARNLDAATQRLLAQLALDAGRLPAARQALEAAADLLGSTRARRELLFERARLALLEGRADEAMKALRRPILKESLRQAEGALLLALAAHEVGDQKVKKEALEIAKDLGAKASF